MMELFDCDDLGKMGEYVWCKINKYDGFTFAQKVMLQSFSDEFALSKRVPITPSVLGKTLIKSTEEDVEPPGDTT